jgi:D-3-phosphoglycerate dehydrogenase / 2-oxoglutarate reductase
MKPKITIFEAIHESGIALISKFADIKIAYGVDRVNCLKLSSESDAIVVKSVVQVDKELLDCSPRLRLIGRAGTGTDNINISEAKKRNIEVFTVPTGNSVSAAEFTILQMLMLCRRIPEVTSLVDNNDFRRSLLEGRELQKMTIGLIGIGNVGTLLAERLEAFGCKVLGFDPYQKDKTKFISHGGICEDSLNDLLSKVDILSLHAKLTSENYHMLSKKQFKTIKPGLLFVNCARAELVDENVLLEFINNGKVAAASLDVLNPEPPFDLSPKEHTYNHELLNHPKVIVTPHIGASTIEAQKRISINLAEQLKFYFDSK